MLAMWYKQQGALSPILQIGCVPFPARVADRSSRRPPDWLAGGDSDRRDVKKMALARLQRLQ